MTKVPLFLLPCSSSSIVDGPTIVDGKKGLLLSMVCDDDGVSRKFEILFAKPRALRKREEIYCTSWHIDDAFDTVCEVRQSEWLTS